MKKTAILASALLLALPLAAPAAESELYGTWKLVSQSQKLADTGEIRLGRGKTPNGYVTFTPDGRVMSIILSDKRPKPESAAKVTDQQRIELYAGTYKLEGNKLTYFFDATHNEIAARAAVRQIKIEGRRITMVNEPGPATSDGKMVVTTTVWEKVQAPKK